MSTYKIPCGQVLGHGDYCATGHLCSACTEIEALRRRVGCIDIRRSTEAGVKDVFLYFTASDGWKAALSIASIAARLSKETSGRSVIAEALVKWIADRHGEP